MKKFKLLLIIPIIVCSAFLFGCEKDSEDVKATVGQMLVKQFASEIKTSNVEDVMNNISKNEVIGTAVDVAKLNVKEDYISGFSTEIKDYKSGYAIRPMIGSIPFVAYVFEVDNPEEFEKTLKDNADLRWNICTAADSIETSIYENYVFVVLAPNSFEEE